MTDGEFLRAAAEPAPRSKMTERRIRNSLTRTANIALASILGLIGVALSVTWLSIADEPNAITHFVAVFGCTFFFVGLPLAAYVGTVYDRAGKVAASGRLHCAAVTRHRHYEHKCWKYTGVDLAYVEGGVRYQTSASRLGWFQPHPTGYVFAAPEVSNACYVVLPEQGSSTEMVSTCVALQAPFQTKQVPGRSSWRNS